MIKYGLIAMLIFVPITLLAKFVFDASEMLIFITSALAVIPLAKYVGEATEELAIHTGPQLGGLLNATLGNAAELIITIFAIQKGLYELVRASITGSILGNLLLIMGLSMLFGGLKNGMQTFNRRTAAMNGTLVLLSVVALLIPSLFDVAIQQDLAAELRLSEWVAIVMIILYVISVAYSFMQGNSGSHAPVEDADEEHHEAKWTISFAIGILAAATIGIVLMSEALVGAVEAVTETIGLSEIFIGLIVIPLVGNVAEHLVAVQVAYKNKMELSMAVSLGSSLQIALFVAPVLVFISLIAGPEGAGPLLLVFSEFELIALVASALVAANIAQDGESNWLEGTMLLAVYIIIAIAFFVLPAEAGEASHGALNWLPFAF